MRNTFLFMMVSLDGFFEGPNHDLSWHNTDQAFVDFADKQLDESDTLIFGHTTYDMMADFWTSPEALEEDATTATRMNALRKVVFSHNEMVPKWQNTEASTNLVEKMNELKAEPGKDIAVLGSSHLGKDMFEANLLDEVRIMVNPVFIGSGSTLFEGLHKNLELKSTRTFENGNVLLTYIPANVEK